MPATAAATNFAGLGARRNSPARQTTALPATLAKLDRYDCLILDDLGHDGVAKPLHRLSAAAGPGVPVLASAIVALVGGLLPTRQVPEVNDVEIDDRDPI
jgi:hypothetical protein